MGDRNNNQPPPRRLPGLSGARGADRWGVLIGEDGQRETLTSSGARLISATRPGRFRRAGSLPGTL